MKKLFLLFVSFFVFVSCSKPSEPVAYVGIIFPDEPGVERWKEESSVLGNMFWLNNYALTIGMADNAVIQAYYIRQLTSMDCQYLILASIDTKSEDINTALAEFRLNGGKVLCYDRMQITDNVDYFVSVMPDDIGAMQAATITALPAIAGSSVEFVSGPQTDSNSELIFNSAMQAIVPLLDAGDWTIGSSRNTFGQTSLVDWSAATAKKYTLALLAQYYGKNSMPRAFLAANDEQANGVAQAIEEYYDTAVDGFAWPVITGQDNTAAARLRIVAGKQTMTINKNPAQYVRSSYEVINDYWVAGLDFPATHPSYNGVLCTRIKPIKVDKSNIN